MRLRFFVIFIICLWALKIFLDFVPLSHPVISSVSNVLILVVLSYCLSRFILFNYFPTIPIDPFNKAVIVTGSASGFGHDLCIQLDKLGFTVFACVRTVLNDNRVDSLVKSCSRKLQVVKLDVTQEEDIDEAYETVKEFVSNNNLRE